MSHRPPLTPIQRLVLEHLLDCELRGACPTYRELAGHFQWKAVATARDHLRILIDKGFVLPSGGRSRKVQMEVTSQGDIVRLRVRDTGPGIPEEDLERIFERFYQVDPSRALRTGSGLGLAITAWIVQAHEGRIFAANHPGGGAVFTVELPARRR